MSFVKKLTQRERPDPNASEETHSARQRLQRALDDDVRINRIISERNRILRENHLGPMISDALRRRQ